MRVHQEKEGRGWGEKSRPGDRMIRKKGHCVWGSREAGSGGREGTCVGQTWVVNRRSNKIRAEF